MITMKKTRIFLSGLLLLLSLTACSNSKENEPYSSGNSVSENSSVSAASDQSSGFSDSTEKTPPAQSGTDSSTESSTSTTQSQSSETSTENTPSTQSGSDSSTESNTSTTPPQSSGTSETSTENTPPVQSGSDSGTESRGTSTPPSSVSSETSTDNTSPAQSGSDSGTESSTSTTQPPSSITSGTKPDPTQSTVTPSEPEDDPQTSDGKENSEYMMNIKIGSDTLTATLERNSSAEALLELLSKGSVTVQMSDYAGMEKVGTLPESLPRNDEHINTDACDLILYQGNQFVIYYDTNSWSLTRLGKIDNVSKSELRKILGTGDVTAVLSLH